jgi:hypothetical protein
MDNGFGFQFLPAIAKRVLETKHFWYRTPTCKVYPVQDTSFTVTPRMTKKEVADARLNCVVWEVRNSARTVVITKRDLMNIVNKEK